MTLSREQWLEERKKGIGGSDSAAVLGLSKWKSPYQVWCDKKGYNPLESSDNASLFWGRTLEPVIRQHYSDITGYSVAETEIYFMPNHDYIFATVDGLVIEDPDRILEIKTSRTAEGWGEPETDQIPVEYLCQCQHYMMVYNRHITDVAVLIGGSDFRIYHVEASTEVQNHLLREYAEFWELVKNDTPPEPRSFDDVIDFQNNIITLKVKDRTTVGGKIHSIPIIPQLCEILSKQKKINEYVFNFRGKPITSISRSWHNIFYKFVPAQKEELTSKDVIENRVRKGKIVSYKRVLRDPELPYTNFHTLRHTAATWILKKTNNLKITQQILGHADIKTTLKYAHILDDEKRKALESVFD